MRGLPYTGFPDDDILTQVKLIIPLQEFDGAFKNELETHLRRGGFVNGSVEVDVNPDSKRINRVTFVPTKKSDKTKPALTEARNILAKAINDWYVSSVIKKGDVNGTI